jgi:hypothetical protein
LQSTAVQHGQAIAELQVGDFRWIRIVHSNNFQNSGFNHPQFSASAVGDFDFSNTTGATLTFYNLVLVSGDFIFSFNHAHSADFPSLSNVSGNFFVTYNVFLVSFQAAKLKNIGGVVSIVGNNVQLSVSLSPLYQLRCDGGIGPKVADLQGCTRVIADRSINSSSVAVMTYSLLTYTDGHLFIFANTALTTIALPSLSTVVGGFDISYNAALTFAHLPKLTYIGTTIGICSNNAAFLIPSGPPDAPTGGLVVSGTNKGQKICHYQQGSGPCGGVETCP